MHSTYIIMFFLLLFTTGWAETNGPVGVLANPGMETGDRLPEGWTIYQSPGTAAVFVWDKTTAYAGQRALHIRNEGPGSASWLAECRVKENCAYVLSARVKITPGQSSFAMVDLWVRGSIMVAGKRQVWDFSGSEMADKKAEWKKLTLEFTTPPGAECMGVWLRSLNGKGDELWFDDVELAEQTSAPPQDGK